MPACETPDGCPVYELASDPVLDEFATDFMVAKNLYTRTKDPRTQATLFDKWGLYEDPYTLLELEAIYSEWLRKQQAKES